MTRIPVFTGFGDPNNPAAFVPMQFLADETTGKFPDWTLEPVIVERHVPGSARVVVQNMGNGQATVTWQAWIGSRPDYYRLMSFLATRQTVVVSHGLQSLAGTQITQLGKVYDRLAGTQLTLIENAQHAWDGIIECDVTFTRPVNLATLGTDV